MKICSKCSLEYDDECLYCNRCGSKLNEKVKERFCQYCGKKIKIDSEFCSYCGKSIIKKEIDVKEKSVKDGSFFDENIDVNCFFKRNSEAKESLVAFLYLCSLIVWFFMYRFARAYYTESKLFSMGFESYFNVPSLKDTIFFIIVGYILLFVLYLVIKYLNFKNTSKWFLGIVCCVTASVIGAFLGVNIFIFLSLVVPVSIILLMIKIAVEDKDLSNF